jgi:hypothetical protein
MNATFAQTTMAAKWHKGHKNGVRTWSSFLRFLRLFAANFMTPLEVQRPNASQPQGPDGGVQSAVKER